MAKEIREVLAQEEQFATGEQNREAIAWLESFKNQLDFGRKKDWIRSNLPKTSSKEATQTPEITLEAFLEVKRVQTIKIGGKPFQQLEEELDQDPDINVSSYARDMMHHEKFTTLETAKDVDLVWVQVKDLGLTRGGTTRQIFERADALPFLERCPAEVGPHLRLIDKDQPLNTLYYIAMNTITDRHGHPGVFALERRGDGLWMDGHWARPDGGWPPGGQGVFAVRKPETLESK